MTWAWDTLLTVRTGRTGTECTEFTGTEDAMGRSEFWRRSTWEAWRDTRRVLTSEQVDLIAWQDPWEMGCNNFHAVLKFKCFAIPT